MLIDIEQNTYIPARYTSNIEIEPLFETLTRTLRDQKLILPYLFY